MRPWTGTHLDDGNLGVFPYLQDRKRHADVIVQVPFGRRHMVTGTQNRPDHLLGSGFPVGAGKADDGDIELLPMVCSQLLQRLQRIRHLDEPGIGGLHRIVHHGIGGAGFQGLERKRIAVKVLSLQGHEKLALLNGAGVGIKTGALQVYLV